MVEQVETEVGLEKFKDVLKGWMTNPDGDDYCPVCWEIYFESFRRDEELIYLIETMSKTTFTLVVQRKILDDCLVTCSDCGRMVFIYNKKKEGK